MQGLLPGIKLLEGDDMRAWARDLPTLAAISNDIMPERKRQDEAAAIEAIKAASREFECGILPVVARNDDGETSAWMHVISYHLSKPEMARQAMEDQSRCATYIEEVLRNFEVRFEFIRDDAEPNGFQVQLLANW